MESVLDLKSRVSTAKPLDYMRDHPEERQKRTQRFNNVKVTDLGLQFDSKAEHKRWSYLAKLERDGEISRLRLQVPFELIPAQVAPDGTKVRATVYVADFTYLDKDGVLIVEDPKGVGTPEWRIKRKLMLMVHGIWVREIRS
jgi:hypothetical protein